jgi:hypothetical protein
MSITGATVKAVMDRLAETVATKSIRSVASGNATFKRR